jgi:hypothetical protein
MGGGLSIAEAWWGKIHQFIPMTGEKIQSDNSAHC